jgi:hypothetical protein
VPDLEVEVSGEWKSRDPGVPETLLIWPKFEVPNVVAGFENTTLFQTLMVVDSGVAFALTLKPVWPVPW